MLIEYEPRFLDEAVRSAIGARPEGRSVPSRARARLRHRRSGSAWRRVRRAERRMVRASRCSGPSLAAAFAEEPLVVGGRRALCRGAPAGACRRRCRADRAGAHAPIRGRRSCACCGCSSVPNGCSSRRRSRRSSGASSATSPTCSTRPSATSRTCPPASVGRTHERLLRDRYRAAWNATVDGRLVRAGKLDAAAREQRWAEFAAVFGTLDEAAPAAFADALRRPRSDPCAPRRPGDGAANGRGGPRGGLRRSVRSAGARRRRVSATAPCCPSRFRPRSAPTFPPGRPDDGCCRQCADLYAARPLSRAEAATFPGIR